MTFSLTGCIIDGKGHTLMDTILLAIVFMIVFAVNEVGHSERRNER